MTLLLEPDQIASSRPPDRVTYTDWEVDPDDHEPLTETRFVAERWTLFKVMSYALERRVFRRERRKRLEFWDEPARLVPYVLEPATVITHEVDGIEVSLMQRRVIEGGTVGRSVWEYRRRWHVSFFEDPPS